MTYARPRDRAGMTCWFVRWNPDGTIREARYRKREPDRPVATETSSPPSRARGLVRVTTPARPSQGTLI